MQKGSHLVCGMLMLVGAEKKKLAWKNNIFGPGKKSWLTPAMQVLMKPLLIVEYQRNNLEFERLV